MRFTATQGRYLAFIHAHLCRYGCPPSETEMAEAMCVSPPSAHLMMKTLEKRGLILRHPGKARAIELLISPDEIPNWNGKKHARAAKTPVRPVVEAPPAKLYVLGAYLRIGPIAKAFQNKQCSRVIEIRGDQTLEKLHEILFEAFDRFEHHLYEFQFGKRPFDPDGPNYGIPDGESKSKTFDARTTTIDSLDLKVERVFGYWFDFGDDWLHTIQVDRIDDAIPTVPYPRIAKRIGKSPPQYDPRAQ